MQHSWRTVGWVVILAAHTVVLLMKAADVDYSNSNGRECVGCWRAGQHTYLQIYGDSWEFLLEAVIERTKTIRQ